VGSPDEGDTFAGVVGSTDPDSLQEVNERANRARIKVVIFMGRIWLG
jgi:ABC-type sugar transport system substrate-binding protein